MVDFWQTGDGKRFYQGTMPRVADALEQTVKELKRQNDLKEEELPEKVKGPVEGKTGLEGTR